MKRKIKKIIAGMLFTSMLVGSVPTNAVYGIENQADEIKEDYSFDMEGENKQFVEEHDTQEENQDGVKDDSSSDIDAVEETENVTESGGLEIAYGQVNFVYIESPYVQTPDTQRIVFSFDKEITGAETVALTIEDEEGNQEEWNLVKQSGSLYLFEKEYVQGASAGIYKASYKKQLGRKENCT